MPRCLSGRCRGVSATIRMTSRFHAVVPLCSSTTQPEPHFRDPVAAIPVTSQAILFFRTLVATGTATTRQNPRNTDVVTSLLIAESLEFRHSLQIASQTPRTRIATTCPEFRFQTLVTADSAISRRFGRNDRVVTTGTRRRRRSIRQSSFLVRASSSKPSGWDDYPGRQVHRKAPSRLFTARRPRPATHYRHRPPHRHPIIRKMKRKREKGTDQEAKKKEEKKKRRKRGKKKKAVASNQAGQGWRPP